MSKFSKNLKAVFAVIKEKNSTELLKRVIYLLLIFIAGMLLFKNSILLVVCIGLLSLNLTVLIHETGHYIIARLSGVEILVFSVGMGPRLFGFKRKGVDYRVSLLPLGGYVRMKGESLFEEALQKNDRAVLEQPGSLFAVNNFKRIMIAVAGAAFNLISAVIFFFIAHLIGFSSPTDTVITPISAFQPNYEISAAADSGIQKGDRITEVNGETIYSFSQLADFITNSNGELSIVVIRDEKEVPLTLILKQTDSGYKAGITPLFSTEISAITEGSYPNNTKLKKGDIITSINGEKVEALSYYQIFLASKQGDIKLEYKRDNKLLTTTISQNSNGANSAFSLAPLRITENREGFFNALKKGITRPALMIIENFTGLYKVVKDPKKDIKDSMSGPIGITTGIGSLTLSGFHNGFSDGLGNFFLWTAIISSIIAIMNLLPIPALDGGLIMFSIIESIRRKRFLPKTFYYYQLIGFTFVIILTVGVIYIDIF